MPLLEVKDENFSIALTNMLMFSEKIVLSCIFSHVPAQPTVVISDIYNQFFLEKRKLYLQRGWIQVNQNTKICQQSFFVLAHNLVWEHIWYPMLSVYATA